MKNRNLNHKDDWATPPIFVESLNLTSYFDPCPYHHDINKWNGLDISWSSDMPNFINPPYSLKLKEAFVTKAIEESKKNKLCIMLLPVSTSTKLFHNYIKPNAKKIDFVKGRIKFIGINSKGQYVNWHLWDKNPPVGSEEVKNSGMHDSMIVWFY